jgi:hypothetical protein
MGPTRAAIGQNLAARLCWQAAGRDDSRVARRLYRKQVVDEVYRLDAGAWLDDFCHVLQERGVVPLIQRVQAKGSQRERLPFGPDVLVYGLKTWFGLERMKALPALLCSDEALMRLVGFTARQVHEGVCQRGAPKRVGPRPEGPMCPEPLAHTIVKCKVRDVEGWCNGGIRALAQAGVFGTKLTGLVEAPDLEPTAQYAGGGQGTRQRQLRDTRGQGHAIEVTVYGWQLIVLSEARPKLPLAATVVPSQEPEGLARRALVAQAQTTLAGQARLDTRVFDRGFWEGTERWWLDQHGRLVVGSAKEQMGVTTDARAPAAAGDELTSERRAHTVRHGQGKAAWSERLETAGVGLTGLTPDDQFGPPAHGRHHHRRELVPNPLNAVVVRTWNHRDDGPGGKTVFLTNAPVHQPLQPVDDDADRSLLENCGIQESTQPWDLGHPPQKTARAVRGQVVFTRLLVALATADRWLGAQEEAGGELVGWQRWRRQRQQHTRDQVIVCVQDGYGSFPMAEYSILVGGKLQKVPPGIGTRRDILATYGL